MNVVLSKIDRMPDAGIPAVQRAYDDVRAMRKTQLMIAAEFNQALEREGLDRVSPSAFSRWVQKVRAGTAQRPADVRIGST